MMWSAVLWMPLVVVIAPAGVYLLMLSKLYHAPDSWARGAEFLILSGMSWRKCTFNSFQGWGGGYWKC